MNTYQAQRIPRTGSRSAARAPASRRAWWVIAAAAMVALLWPAVGRATLISPGFPIVNSTTGNYAIRTAYTTQIFAGAASEGDSKTDTFYPAARNQVAQLPLLTQSVSTPVNAIVNNAATVHGSAHGGDGTIGGYVDATVTCGPIQASIEVVVDYLDLVHFTRTCVPTIAPHIDGVPTRQVGQFLPSAVASASGKFESYFFSGATPPPAGGKGFNPAYYGICTVTPNAVTLDSAENTLEFQAGSDWWIAGRLTLDAGASIPIQTGSGSDPGISLFATGDFEHTAFLTIDTPDSTDPAYTTASGIDYSSASLVPEPTTFSLLLIAAAPLLRRRGVPTR